MFVEELAQAVQQMMGEFGVKERVHERSFEAAEQVVKVKRGHAPALHDPGFAGLFGGGAHL